MTTLAAWERIKTYTLHHAHPDDHAQIQADIEAVEGELARPVSPVLARTVEDPRIVRIAALCDEQGEHERRFLPGIPVVGLVSEEAIRAVLGEVQPTPPHGIDRDALEAIANLHIATGAGWDDEGREGFIARVQAILAAAAPTGLREALVALIRDETGWDWEGEHDEPEPIFGCDTRIPSSEQMIAEFADRVLALVHPVEGVVLTPEEVDIALEWREDAKREGWVYPAAYDALAARLEASS